MIPKILLVIAFSTFHLLELFLNKTIPTNTRNQLACVNLLHLLSLTIILYLMAEKYKERKSLSLFYHFYLVVLIQKYELYIFTTINIVTFLINLWVIQISGKKQVYGVNLEILIASSLLILYEAYQNVRLRKVSNSSSWVLIILLGFLFLYIQKYIEPHCSQRQLSIVGLCFLLMTSIVMDKMTILQRHVKYFLIFLLVQVVIGHHFIKKIFAHKSLTKYDFFTFVLYFGVLMFQIYEFKFKNKELMKIFHQIKRIDRVVMFQNNEQLCSICLSEGSPLSNIVQLPCHHLFHEQCIRSWFRNRENNLTCPNCRYQVFE